MVGSSSCKSATGVRVAYKSDLTCNAGKLPQSVRFSLQRVGLPASFDSAKPETPRASADCTAGSPSDLGDLLIRPNPNDPGLAYDLVTVAATGTTSTEAACGIGPDGAVVGKLEGAECIVSKRRVRFAEGQELSFQVFLSARCAGISCPSETTCDPLTALCVGIPTNGEPQVQDAGVQGTKIEPEAGPNDASVVDATVDAGIPGIPDCAVKPGQAALCGQTYPLTARAAFPIVAHEKHVAFATTPTDLTTITEIGFQKMTPTPTMGLPLSVPGGAEVLALGYDGTGNLYAGVRPAALGQVDAIFKRAPDWTQVGFRADPKNDSTHAKLLSLVTSPSGLGGVFGNAVTAPTSIVPFLLEDKSGALEPASNATASFTFVARPEVAVGGTGKTRIRVPLPASGSPMGSDLLAFEGAGLATEPGVLPRGIPTVTELVGGDVSTVFYVAKDSTSTKLFQTLPGTLGPSAGELVDGVEGPTASDGERIYLVSKGQLLSVARAAPYAVCRVASASGSPTLPVRSVAVDGDCVYTLAETRGFTPIGQTAFELRASFKAATPR